LEKSTRFIFRTRGLLIIQGARHPNLDLSGLAEFVRRKAGQGGAAIGKNWRQKEGCGRGADREGM